MLIECEQVMDILVIRVMVNRLVSSTAFKFHTEVTAIIRLDNHNLIIDLSEVFFIDSSGLGAVVNLKKLIDSKGGIRLCGLTSQVDEKFRLMKLDTIIDIFDNPHRALTASALTTKP